MMKTIRRKREPAKQSLWPVVLLSALCLGLLPGCSSTAGEEDHAAHHIPEHRPRDLPSAAAQVRSRWSAIRASSPSEQPARWTELGDILRWLPEIAGESNLGRAEWDEVQRISIELEAMHDRGKPSGSVPEDESRRQVLLDQLDSLASRATESIYGRRASPESIAEAPPESPSSE